MTKKKSISLCSTIGLQLRLKIRMKKIIKDSHEMCYYISMLSTTGGKLKFRLKKF